MVPGAGELPDDAQRRISVLLAGMALRVLHDHGVAPFEDGYEGTPFNDFIGRLYDWPWLAS